jgi:hypothetical protein
MQIPNLGGYGADRGIRSASDEDISRHGEDLFGRTQILGETVIEADG